MSSTLTKINMDHIIQLSERLEEINKILASYPHPLTRFDTRMLSEKTELEQYINSGKNHFRQHVTPMVSGVTPLEFDFYTTDQLINHEYVQRYVRTAFDELVMSDDHLMVISDEGYHWWVIGQVSKPELITLPKWTGQKYRPTTDSPMSDFLGTPLSVGDIVIQAWTTYNALGLGKIISIGKSNIVVWMQDEKTREFVSRLRTVRDPKSCIKKPL